LRWRNAGLDFEMHFDLLPQLTALLGRLDEAAVAAAQQGDAQQNPYYCGLMIGLEIACDELAQLVDEALHAQVKLS
jgi:hypothetical protein